MRALVFTGPGVVELQDVPPPSGTGPGEVVLDVRAAGICGSELHGFRSVGMRRPPLVMGHELAGTTPDGRRVVVNPLLSCGSCDLCGRGDPELCRDRQLLGVHRPGGFAERAAVPESAVHELPAEMSWETAVLVEPLANAVHAWGLAGLGAGERVAIIGAGAIGLVTLLVARDRGLTDVTVVDRARERLDLAARLGASHCVTELDGEHDVVVDAVGTASTRRTSVERLRPGGTTVWLGLAETGVGFDGNDLVRNEKRVLGSFAYTPADFAGALAMAPHLDLGWATPVPSGDSQAVFMRLADGATNPVKAVIRF
jgi:threonine dehydrogenase-like Zn-dependent dehydrogenase